MGLMVGNVQAVRSRHGTIFWPLDRCLRRIMGICLTILCSRPIPDVRNEHCQWKHDIQRTPGPQAAQAG